MESNVSNPHVPRPNGKERAEPFTALVVDDEESGHLLLQQRFRKELKAGLLTFVFVTSGKEAMVCLKGRPDLNAVLVLSDLDASSMTALALIQRIRATSEDLPIHFATNRGSPQHFRKALDYGVTGYQIKPIDFGRLKREVFRIHMP